MRKILFYSQGIALLYSCHKSEQVLKIEDQDQGIKKKDNQLEKLVPSITEKDTKLGTIVKTTSSLTTQDTEEKVNKENKKSNENKEENGNEKENVTNHYNNATLHIKTMTFKGGELKIENNTQTLSPNK